MQKHHATHIEPRQGRLLPNECTCIMQAHDEKKYTLPGLDVDSAKRENSEQLSCLFTREGLQGMVEGKEYYAVDMTFPFAASFF